MLHLETKIATLEEVKYLAMDLLKGHVMSEDGPGPTEVNRFITKVHDEIVHLKIQAEKKAKEDGFKALLEKVG